MAENFPGAKPLAAPSLATDNPIPPLPNNLTAGEFLLSLINKGPQSQPNPPPAFPGAGNVSFLPPGFLGYPAASPIPRSAWPDNRIPAASESGIPPPGFYGHGPLPQGPPPGFPPQLGFLDPKNPPPPQSPHLIFGSFVTPIVSQPHSSDFIQRNGAQPLRNLNSDNLSFVLEEKLKIRDPGNPNSISIANKTEEHVSTSEEVEVEESTESSTIKSTSTSRNKDYRSDFSRGHHVSGQRVRYRRREIRCRRDITHFNSKLMQIYESLTPPEDEKLKQIDLLQRLEKLVIQEWPNAGIHLYGSCANSFGTSNSDIDVCLQIPDLEKEKSEVLLRLAEILESNNLEDVQALTRARVPIVKLKDPMTSISCDICINNMLAVVNTKLLRDYSQIDSRLRQLVFIVKHWAKARGVNDTYQGTLSSYAYALMCIHFLQIRRPPILPCLQEMQPTYAMKVDGVECTFFDQVNELRNFGSKNKEGISELLWGFFNYWAYHHDYMNDVISVRTGGIIRKHSKDWTRRIGNDRHLICIEDPFELSHDLGRVVDKFTIKILREEFERAADIMQFDPHPITRLFEPYVRPALDQS